MTTESLSTLKIHKLTQAQYDRELQAGNINGNELYLTPDERYYTESEIDTKVSDLQTAIDGKADNSHAHAISDVTDLQSALDGKVAQTDLDTHTGNTTVHITSTERSNWNAAKSHADSAHAPSNAEKNQNAFSNITVGNTTVAADTATDTVTFVGSNMTITPDATNDKITFAVADGSTSAKGLVQLTDSTSSTSTTTAATPNSVKSAYDLANTANTNAATAQTRADSAYSLAESKVDSLSDLGITATATELNYVGGVTSNIQTQLDGKAAIDDIPEYIQSGAKTDSTIGSCATAEGYETEASGDYSHAEGINTQTLGLGSHAEGHSTEALGDHSHAEGYETEASGSASHAEGANTTASKNYSHAEGYGAEASGTQSHAEGYYTTASGSASHAEGCGTTASGDYSHAGGCGTVALSNSSHAEGYYTTASGIYSHAGGYYTTALDYQFVIGKYNNADTASIAGVAGVSSRDSQSADETLFVVGYGTSQAVGNAFRISANGKCRGVSTFTASGADFAELFEWEDGNPNNEDRRGLFVTLEGEKIKLANNGDDFIGVISGAEAFLGNSASEEWQGKYLTDVFGTRLTQTIEIPEKIDDATGKIITPAHTTTQYVLNPDYNPNEQYIMRENRKEWGMVGLLGQVVVIDDGTCVVGGYVKPSLNGVGTASDSGYRVMKRIDETHIKVLVK